MHKDTFKKLGVKFGSIIHIEILFSSCLSEVVCTLWPDAFDSLHEFELCIDDTVLFGRAQHDTNWIDSKCKVCCIQIFVYHARPLIAEQILKITPYQICTSLHSQCSDIAAHERLRVESLIGLPLLAGCTVVRDGSTSRPELTIKCVRMLCVTAFKLKIYAVVSTRPTHSERAW